MRKIAVIVLGLMMFTFCYVRAADDTGKGKENEASEMDKNLDSPGAKKAIAYLAKKFNVTEQVIIDLRNKDFGYGEIMHALVISSKSGQPLDTIVALRESGMGWGEIAKKYDLKLGTITSEVKKDKKFIKKDVTKQEMKEKPEKHEKMEHHKMMGKPERQEKPEKP